MSSTKWRLNPVSTFSGEDQILDYFNEDSLHFFEPGSVENLSEVILDAYRKPSHSRAVLDKGMAIYHMHRWELQKHHFVTLVKDLLQKDAYRLKKVSYKKAIKIDSYK